MVTFYSRFLYEPLQVTKWHKWFDSFSATCGTISTQIPLQLSQVYSHTNFFYEYMNSLRPDWAWECIFRAFIGTNFESVPVPHQLWWCLCGFNMVCTPLSAGGGVGVGVEPLTKFSKEGAWQELSVERGVAGKEEGNFFQRGLQYFQKKIN